MPDLRQLEERPQSLGDDVRVRGEQVVGQDFPVRQAQQRQRCAGEEVHLGAQAVELARRIDDHDVQAAVGAHGLRQRERGRAAVELVPAQARLRCARAAAGAGVRTCGSGHAKPAQLTESGAPAGASGAPALSCVQLHALPRAARRRCRSGASGRAAAGAAAVSRRCPCRAHRGRA